MVAAPTLSGGVTAPGPLTSVSGYGFAGLDRFSSGGFFPPDTQIAVGNGDVVENVNAEINIYNATYGTALAGYPKDLKAWWCAAGGQGSSCTAPSNTVTDPRVIYDPLSARFFATILFTNTSNQSAVDLAVSTTSDPTGAWVTYTVQTQASGLYDQPKLAVTGDKVTVTANFSTEMMYVIQKSDVVAGHAYAGSQVFTMGSRTNIVPALALTGGNTQYLAYITWFSGPVSGGIPSLVTDIGVITVTGTPAAGNVTESEIDPGISPFFQPPGAAQPNGAVRLDPGDAVYTSVVVWGSTLLAAGTDGCGAGDSMDCLRLDVVNLSNGTVTQDTDVTGGANNLLYPAVSVDGNGNGWVAWSVVGANTYAYAAVAAWSGIPYNVASGAQVYMALGTSDYCDIINGGQCQGTSGNGGFARWGDYAAIVPDPANATHMWAAQEFGAAGTNNNPGGVDWETQIDAVSFS
jgi:hypothetical protein